MRGSAREVSIDGRDEVPRRGGLASSAGSPNHDLVPVGVLSDDLDGNLVATVEAQCRTLSHDRIITRCSQGIIIGMSAKAKLLAQVEKLSGAEAAVARIVVEFLDVASDEPEMVGLPEAWRTFEDGTVVPNWVAGLDEVRARR